MSFYSIIQKGKPLIIKDEGITISTDAGSIDFTGAGILASAIDQDVTVNVDGGGSAEFNIETPTGSVNGSNQTFTVSAEPEFVISDGMIYFAGNGYSYDALEITMDIPPSQYIKVLI